MIFKFEKVISLLLSVEGVMGMKLSRNTWTTDTTTPYWTASTSTRTTVNGTSTTEPWTTDTTTPDWTATTSKRTTVDVTSTTSPTWDWTTETWTTDTTTPDWTATTSKRTTAHVTSTTSSAGDWTTETWTTDTTTPDWTATTSKRTTAHGTSTTSSAGDWTTEIWTTDTTTPDWTATTSSYWTETTSDQWTTGCPQGWVNSVEGCFLFANYLNLTWREAQEECERLGGFLAEPKNHSQILLLTSLAYVEESLLGPQNWWIGLTDQGHEGRYIWQHSVSDLTAPNWCPASPGAGAGYDTRDCVMMDHSAGYSWADTLCGGDKAALVCQRESEH